MGAIAAAGIIRKQKDIVAAFRTGGATSPKSANTTAALGIHQGFVFERLGQRGVLKQASPERWYLDEARWEEHRSTRRRLALLMVGAILIIGAALMLIGQK